MLYFSVTLRGKVVKRTLKTNSNKQVNKTVYPGIKFLVPP